MASKSAKPTSNTSFWIKSMMAAAVLLAGIVFAYGQYQNVRPANVNAQAENSSPASASNTRPTRFADGPPSVEERQAFRQQMYASLNLTPAQQAQLEALDEQLEPGEWRDNLRQRREAMNSILTPEQQEVLTAQRQSRMERRMNERTRMLSPADQKKFREKFEERRGQWQERRESVRSDDQ